MRELFDEDFQPSPLDPHESARASSRGPQRRRFYQSADVSETPDGFAVLLDGKVVKTPGKRALIAPKQSIADMMAFEWNAQAEILDPLTMPVTRLANSIVDGVVDQCEAVADDMAKYFGSDLLFYRASHPDGLIARQSQHWDPVLDWSRDTLGAHFILTEGIMPVAQPEAAIKAARATLPADAWSIGALHLVTTTTGSALLALALWHGTLDADAVWAAAHVDEDWNFETWGQDDEAMTRREGVHHNFSAAAAVIKALV